MTLPRGGPRLFAALLTTVLVAGCTTSEPAATDSSEPTQTSASASPTDSALPPRDPTSPTPSISPTPPSLPMIGWGDGKYPVPCFPRTPTVKFEDGKATYRGFQVTARVVARGDLASYESVSIHVVCTGASSSPSSVLVYIGALDGPEYVGLALTPEEYIDLKKARYVDEELELTGYGFTRRAPLCCPDLLVTKAVALRDGELAKTGLTKEPLKD
jgi:hypothetical protein